MICNTHINIIEPMVYYEIQLSLQRYIVIIYKLFHLTFLLLPALIIIFIMWDLYHDKIVDMDLFLR